MKTSTAIALALATLLSSSLAAYTQAEQPTPYHHYHVHRVQGPHHTVHHRFVAHNPAPAPRRRRPHPQPLRRRHLAWPWPHIAPYPDNKGDEDGLSEDRNDCNKGCVDGNTPD